MLSRPSLSRPGLGQDLWGTLRPCTGLSWLPRGQVLACWRGAPPDSSALTQGLQATQSQAARGQLWAHGGHRRQRRGSVAPTVWVKSRLQVGSQPRLSQVAHHVSRSLGPGSAGTSTRPRCQPPASLRQAALTPRSLQQPRAFPAACHHLSLPSSSGATQHSPPVWIMASPDPGEPGRVVTSMLSSAGSLNL